MYYLQTNKETNNQLKISGNIPSGFNLVQSIFTLDNLDWLTSVDARRVDYC